MAVASLPRLRDVPRAQRTAGNCVATADGTHVMAFLGDGRVIGPDPFAGCVTVLDEAAGTSPWLERSVEIVQWSLLGSAPPASAR